MRFLRSGSLTPGSQRRKTKEPICTRLSPPKRSDFIAPPSAVKIYDLTEIDSSSMRRATELAIKQNNTHHLLMKPFHVDSLCFICHAS